MITPTIKEAKIRTSSKANILTCDYNLSEDLKNLGTNKLYYIRTYGCQMNEHDSENMAAILESMNFSSCDNYLEADVIILNTCSIRENAHNKAFGMLGRLKNLKSKKNIIVGLAGCMSQEESVVNKVIEKYKWLDFVIGTHNIHRLPDVLRTAMTSSNQTIEVWSKEGDIIEGIPAKRASIYKAWVNIMYGCDKFCTYCVVPMTRGKQRSRLSVDIVKEVQELKESGYKEVTLLGQNVNAYGKDLDDNSNMASLLTSIAKTNIDRIRFVTSHPWDFTSEMIDVIKNNSNIMPYIHLPVQSGSNKILKLMGRRYTKESYLNLINDIKKKIPNVSITTDIIVGFPGETKEDFLETLDLYKVCKFDLAYTFIFSAREGTSAALMEDNITLEEKENRLKTLNKLVNEYALINNKKLEGKNVSVLIEGISDKDPSKLTGYTDTSKLVNIKGSSNHIGSEVNVKIEKAKTWSLDGVINE